MKSAYREMLGTYINSKRLSSFCFTVLKSKHDGLHKLRPLSLRLLLCLSGVGPSWLAMRDYYNAINTKLNLIAAMVNLIDRLRPLSHLFLGQQTTQLFSLSTIA